MQVHFRKPGCGSSPLCWEGERLYEAFASHTDIDKVTCEECKALYYYTGKELEVSTASLDLWLDGRERDESAGWRQPVNIDFSRFLGEDSYAEWVSDHISRSLEHLAKELEEMALRMPNVECAPE